MKIPAELDQQLRKFIESNIPEKPHIRFVETDTVTTPDPRTMPEGISVIIKAKTETKLFKKVGNTVYLVNTLTEQI